jgi:tetratricopeptide (TPR) repeat protein
VQAEDLDRVTRASLRTLPDGLAELVARHLAAAALVLPDDPALALAHTQAASRRAGRVAVVREAVGVAAYAAGDYRLALTELRAAARISGSSEYLPMMADCERGLGNPEKALALAGSPEAASLDRAGKVELLIVAAGARRDLGQADAAVLTLQVPALRSRASGEWLARLRYAYADALLEVGRTREARAWFERAAEVDPEGATDAVERRDELDGFTFADEASDADEAGEASDADEAGEASDAVEAGEASEAQDRGTGEANDDADSAGDRAVGHQAVEEPGPGSPADPGSPDEER